MEMWISSNYKNSHTGLDFELDDILFCTKLMHASRGERMNARLDRNLTWTLHDPQAPPQCG